MGSEEGFNWKEIRNMKQKLGICASALATALHIQQRTSKVGKKSQSMTEVTKVAEDAFTTLD